MYIHFSCSMAVSTSIVDSQVQAISWTAQQLQRLTNKIILISKLNEHCCENLNAIARYSIRMRICYALPGGEHCARKWRSVHIYRYACRKHATACRFCSRSSGTLQALGIHTRNKKHARNSDVVNEANTIACVHIILNMMHMFIAIFNLASMPHNTQSFMIRNMLNVGTSGMKHRTSNSGKMMVE
jgi:hypothetical protein